MNIEKFSFGMGDRFGRQGQAQLQAIVKAAGLGLHVAPVWNKSHREHTTVHTTPDAVRAEANAAVQALGWASPYYVDADHIHLGTVDGFLEASDFYTMDLAEAIGAPVEDLLLDDFVSRNERYFGSLRIPGIDRVFEVTPDKVRAIGRTYLAATRQAGEIYRHIAAAKGADAFIPEVSMDETNEPQTPLDIFFILEALAQEGVPVQTFAPKFTGRFNKGVDYVGDLIRFEQEFEEDVLVLKQAAQEFGLPRNLKLSVHSGSDKFSIYEPIRRILKKHDAGLHIKTAGTTWLDECIGLAMAGDDGFAIAQKVYEGAYTRIDEISKPYATVIDIDPAALPHPTEVATWTGERFAAALRHEPDCAEYNSSLRQLLHVGYKIAAEMGPVYLDALDRHAEIIAKGVTDNLLRKHLLPIFGTNT